MQRSLAPAVALAVSAVLLLGCAPTSTAQPSPTPTSSPASPSPSPTPEVDPQIVVSLAGVTVTNETGTSSASFDDSAALLDLLETATGELPSPETVEIFPGEPSTLQRYDWDGLSVVADSEGGSPASIAITAAEVGDMQVITEEGVGVGSTRTELIDAGAWALVDEEDPATAANLGLGGQEVPDTQSLTRPGSVGILYELFVLEGDTVIRILAPANDFSDL